MLLKPTLNLNNILYFFSRALHFLVTASVVLTWRWEVYDNVNVSSCHLYLPLHTICYEWYVHETAECGPNFQNLKIFLFWCIRQSPRFVTPLGYDYRYRTCSSLKNFRDLQVNHSSGTSSFFFRELTSFMTFSISRLTFHMRNQRNS